MSDFVNNSIWLLGGRFSPSKSIQVPHCPHCPPTSHWYSFRLYGSVSFGSKSVSLVGHRVLEFTHLYAITSVVCVSMSPSLSCGSLLRLEFYVFSISSSIRFRLVLVGATHQPHMP